MPMIEYVSASIVNDTSLFFFFNWFYVGRHNHFISVLNNFPIL